MSNISCNITCIQINLYSLYSPKIIYIFKIFLNHFLFIVTRSTYIFIISLMIFCVYILDILQLISFIYKHCGCLKFGIYKKKNTILSIYTKIIYITFKQISSVYLMIKKITSSFSGYCFYKSLFH